MPVRRVYELVLVMVMMMMVVAMMMTVMMMRTVMTMTMMIMRMRRGRRRRRTAKAMMMAMLMLVMTMLVAIRTFCSIAAFAVIITTSIIISRIITLNTLLAHRCGRQQPNHEWKPYSGGGKKEHWAAGASSLPAENKNRSGALALECAGLL